MTEGGPIKVNVRAAAFIGEGRTRLVAYLLNSPELVEEADRFRVDVAKKSNVTSRMAWEPYEPSIVVATVPQITVLSKSEDPAKVLDAFESIAPESFTLEPPKPVVGY